jgi:hypothetical protein
VGIKMDEWIRQNWEEFGQFRREAVSKLEAKRYLAAVAIASGRIKATISN